MLAVISVIALFAPTVSKARCNLRLEWTRSWNGTVNSYDYALSVVMDRSENIIVVGVERGDSPFDTLGRIIKYSPTGTVLWTVSRTGVWPFAVTVDASSNLFIAGYERIDTDRWLIIKYSPEGQLLWSRSPVSPGAGAGHAYSIAVDQHGDVVVAGFERNDFPPRVASWLVMKYNQNGQLLWKRTYGNPAGDGVTRCVAIDAAGNVIVAGYETGHNSGQRRNNWLVRKYDPEGRLLWSRSHHGSEKVSHTAIVLVVDDHNNLIVIGESSQYETGQYELMVMRKYSPDGEILWERNFEGSRGMIESNNAVAIDRDGNLLVAGLFWPMDKNHSYTWLIRKYTNSGEPGWRKVYSSPAQLGDSALSIAADPNGSIVVVGYEDRSDLGQATNWLVKKFRQVAPCP